VENRGCLYRFMLGMTGNMELAEDLAQETMVKAIVAYKSWRGGSAFRTWLMAIAVNLYRDGLRKKRPVALDSVDEPMAGGELDEGVLRRLDAARAVEALSRLPEKQRKVVALRLDCGLSYEEIAAILHCPAGTARSRMHAAIESIRRIMGVGYG